MGNQLSTDARAKNATQAANVAINGTVQQTATMADIVNFAFKPHANQEPVVLFVRKPHDNPCSFIGKAITAVANEAAKGNGSAAFIVGTGPCHMCDVPTVYYYEGKDWKQRRVPHLDNAMSAAEGYAAPRGLKTAYHMLADKDLKITAVIHSIVTDERGQITFKDGCAEKLKVNADGTETLVNEKNLAEGSSMWWLWILLLVLIALVIWAVVRRKNQ